jgi:hypothetical protein
LETCGTTGHLAIGRDLENGEYIAVYHPHSCGSVFCPYCAKRKRLKVLEPYKDLLLSLAGNVQLAFVTLTVKNGFDVKERIDFAFKSLTRLYELRPFRPRVWKRIREQFYQELKAYERNLKKQVKSGKLSKAEARKKVDLQKWLFKRFEKRYKNLPDAKQLKFGQIFPAIWAFELTYNAEEGIHPHWHGVLAGEIPKLLLTVLWKEATKVGGVYNRYPVCGKR